MLPLPDFGFALLPDHFRRGYAYEASRSHLQYAQANGLVKLLAITLPSNLASIGLLTKLGFEREDDLIRLPDDGEDLLQLQWTAK